MTVVRDLDLVADMVWVQGGYMPNYFFLQCAGCGRETEPLQGMTLAQALDWAVGHHDQEGGPAPCLRKR